MKKFILISTVAAFAFLTSCEKSDTLPTVNNEITQTTEEDVDIETTDDKINPYKKLSKWIIKQAWKNYKNSTIVCDGKRKPKYSAKGRPFYKSYLRGTWKRSGGIVNITKSGSTYKAYEGPSMNNKYYIGIARYMGRSYSTEQYVVSNSSVENRTRFVRNTIYKYGFYKSNAKYPSAIAYITRTSIYINNCSGGQTLYRTYNSMNFNNINYAK